MSKLDLTWINLMVKRNSFGLFWLLYHGAVAKTNPPKFVVNSFQLGPIKSNPRSLV